MTNCSAIGKASAGNSPVSESLHLIRIAVLGGSSTNHIVDLPEPFLISADFQPSFWQSECGRFYQDAVLDSAEPAFVIETVDARHLNRLSTNSPCPGVYDVQRVQKNLGACCHRTFSCRGLLETLTT